MLLFKDPSGSLKEILRSLQVRVEFLKAIGTGLALREASMFMLWGYWPSKFNESNKNGKEAKEITREESISIYSDSRFLFLSTIMQSLSRSGSVIFLYRFMLPFFKIHLIIRKTAQMTNTRM